MRSNILNIKSANDLDQVSTKFDSQSKILIIGTSGSGKTTLANKLVKILNLKDIELDALFWKENWQQSDDQEFRQKILNAIPSDSGFVIHGNYNKTREITWGKVDIIIWLDYPKLTVMWRVFKRSVFRIISGDTLWSGNKETFKKTFLSKDSIILWAWNTYSLRRKQYLEFMYLPAYSKKLFITFIHPSDTELFIKQLL